MGALPSVFGLDPAIGRLRRLQKSVADADAVTPELVASILADGCPRFRQLIDARQQAFIHRLTAARAWGDLALALIDLELPNWKVRALMCEDGEWSCILARNWAMDWLDLVGQHETMPVAILKAFLVARLNEELQSRP
jgi:hypothetical protein